MIKNTLLCCRKVPMEHLSKCGWVSTNSRARKVIEEKIRNIEIKVLICKDKLKARFNTRCLLIFFGGQKSSVHWLISGPLHILQFKYLYSLADGLQRLQRNYMHPTSLLRFSNEMTALLDCCFVSTFHAQHHLLLLESLSPLLNGSKSQISRLPPLVAFEMHGIHDLMVVLVSLLQGCVDPHFYVSKLFNPKLGSVT